MYKTGFIVLAITFGLGGIMILLWLVGFIGGIGGGLIHLLLVLAMLVFPIGIAASVVLFIVGAAQSRQR